MIQYYKDIIHDKRKMIHKYKLVILDKRIIIAKESNGINDSIIHNYSKGRRDLYK